MLCFIQITSLHGTCPEWHICKVQELMQLAKLWCSKRDEMAVKCAQH